jgi:ethanolamine utilization protein EutN
MRLGRVTGKLWATARIDQHAGKRYLIVQPIDTEGTDRGSPLVCIDGIGAGPGDTIYWARGKEASLAFHPQVVASDATVVGIVDEISTARG